MQGRQRRFHGRNKLAVIVGTVFFQCIRVGAGYYAICDCPKCALWDGGDQFNDRFGPRSKTAYLPRQR